MNIVAHNLLAMNANRMLGITENKRSKATEKLSSGYKVNRAADDAAGLAISEKMRRQIRGLTRGVKNTQDGVSLCQVADGALAEVSDMLHRITELSVQSANGTNSAEDRGYLQEEVSQIMDEIDRIGDSTTFNEQPVFKGADTMLLNPDGSVAIEGNIPFSSIKFADLSIGSAPFNASDNADTLRLQAIVDNAALAANGKTYNLIFGNGSTSDTSFRVTYENNGNPVTKTVKLDSNEITKSNYSLSGNTVSRDFTYQNEDGVDITITQKVVADSGSKTYNISYSIQNNGAENTAVDFMFHADTAYNNNDTCEGYFINGSRVDTNRIYSSATSPFTQGVASPNIIEGAIPTSLSIIDVDNALAFSEKLTLSTVPDSFSIGRYNQIRNWDYYNSSLLPRNLGGSTNREDLGFSLMWNRSLYAGASTTISFGYGIVEAQSDSNIPSDSIHMSDKSVTLHNADNSIWIQSGTEQGHGMFVTIGEMNTEVLGLSGVDVSTASDARRSIDKVKNALQMVSANRSNIGAQQNRLEHTIDNLNNVIENTTAAESQIRDTDIPEEMIRYSNANILSQAGTAMLSQANQTQQNVLNILQ